MEIAGPRVPNDPRSPKNSEFLKGCFVEGDPALERGARKLKRRALLVSILLELALVATLVLYPLLGKGENLTAVISPTVPHIFTGRQIPNRPSPPQPHLNRAVCLFCPSIPPTITTHDPDKNVVTEPEPFGNGIIGLPPAAGVPGGDPNAGTPGPARPETLQPQKRRILVGTIQPAMLVRRVEPIYPAIPKQLGRSGRVELRAIISTDGSIESLEVISGDPLFIQSALAAVREWRYRPTVLNGQPVEVDTHITVVYTLSR
jgi:protein TonB